MSLKFKFSASPDSNLTDLVNFIFVIFSRPTFNICSEISTPMTSQFEIDPRLIAMSAVPVAMSRAFIGLSFLAIFKIFFFHLLWLLKVIIALSKSYSKDIESNIFST